LLVLCVNISDIVILWLLWRCWWWYRSAKLWWDSTGLEFTNRNFKQT